MLRRTAPALLGLTVGTVLLSLLVNSGAWHCESSSEFCSVNPDGSLKLSMNNNSVGSFSSDDLFLNGFFSADIEMPAGDTSATIMAFYLMDNATQSNKDLNHSEIDIELYGGRNASAYMFATNVFRSGLQNLMQERLVGDVSTGFHTYSIQWSTHSLVFRVDGRPYRVLTRDATHPWLDRPMKLHITFWRCNYCAPPETPQQFPLSITVKNIKAKGCIVPNADYQAQPRSCSAIQQYTWFTPWNRPLSRPEKFALRDILTNFGINYWGWAPA